MYSFNISVKNYSYKKVLILSDIFFVIILQISLIDNWFHIISGTGSFYWRWSNQRDGRQYPQYRLCCRIRWGEINPSRCDGPRARLRNSVSTCSTDHSPGGHLMLCRWQYWPNHHSRWVWYLVAQACRCHWWPNGVCA